MSSQTMLCFYGITLAMVVLGAEINPTAYVRSLKRSVRPPRPGSIFISHALLYYSQQPCED